METCSLHLHTKDRHLPLMLRTPFHVFKAPCLQGLMIPSSLTSLQSPINWSQLTELFIMEVMPHRWCVDIALEIMSHCANFLVLTIQVSDYRSANNETPMATVTMPLLTTLSIKAWSIFGPFFDHLRLPALLSFELHLLNRDH
jgi:hypothetical protein